jgi:hypothetical protein
MTRSKRIDSHRLGGKAFTAALLSLGLALPLAAWAQSGLGFMNDSPLSYFNSEDMKLMRANADAVLGSESASAKAEWSNPKTKHSGGAEVVESFVADGMPCKRLRVTNAAKGVKSDAVYPLCKYPGKGWRVRPE